MQKFQGNRSAASRVRQAMPEALPFGGALIVAANLIVTIWHVYVLGKLQPEMTATQLTLFAAAINVIPLCAAALLWSSWRRSAALIFAVFFGAVLAIGLYQHFLRAGPDNVVTMAPGACSMPYRWSAALLVAVDALGCLFGLYAALCDRRGGRAAI